MIQYVPIYALNLYSLPRRGIQQELQQALGEDAGTPVAIDDELATWRLFRERLI